MIRSLLAGFVMIAFTAPLLAQEQAKKDLEAMQGVWMPRKMISGEAEVPKEIRDAFRVTFDGDKLWIKDPKDAALIKLDTSKMPYHLNVSGPKTPGGTDFELYEGIYKFDKGVLFICVNNPGQGRPTEFEAKKGGLFLMELEKAPAKDKK